MEAAHKLIPQDHTLPPLYATENQTDPTVHIKLFTPDSGWSWYITEYSPQEELCFGLVVGIEREMGYFSISELQAVRGPLGLKIERDLYFTPLPLSQLKKQVL